MVGVVKTVVGILKESVGTLKKMNAPELTAVVEATVVVVITKSRSCSGEGLFNRRRWEV
jgi:hypothetical protein